MEKIVNEKNFKQWTTVSDTYHDIRPVPPVVIIELILSWLQRSPEIVVDVGCGTGLSTTIWKDIAKETIGIEPNDEMRKIAEDNVNTDCIVFKSGCSNELNLTSDYADVITVSQAFHWFDIDSTLVEFHRVLKKDGVLAIYDFELPPIFDWEIEKSFLELRRKCTDIYYAMENPPVHNDKNTYHDRIKSFGKFRHSREIMCHGVERYTLQRAMDFILNISNAPFAIEHDDAIKKDIDDLFDLIKAKYDDEIEIIFPYTMVVAVK